MTKKNILTTCMLSQKDVECIEECTMILKVSKSEVIRRAVQQFYTNLKKEGKFYE